MCLEVFLGIDVEASSELSEGSMAQKMSSNLDLMVIKTIVRLPLFRN